MVSLVSLLFKEVFGYVPEMGLGITVLIIFLHVDVRKYTKIAVINS